MLFWVTFERGSVLEVEASSAESAKATAYLMLAHRGRDYGAIESVRPLPDSWPGLRCPPRPVAEFHEERHHESPRGNDAKCAMPVPPNMRKRWPAAFTANNRSVRRLSASRRPPTTRSTKRSRFSPTRPVIQW